MHERQLRTSDPDHVSRFQFVVAVHTVIADGGSISAFEVPDHPLPIGQENLRMVPTCLFLLDHDLIGWRTANGDRFSRNKPENIRPFGAISDYQVREHKKAEKWGFVAKIKKNDAIVKIREAKTDD